MEKLAVGPAVDPRRISLRYSVAHNLEAIANCLGKPVRWERQRSVSHSGAAPRGL